MHGSYSKSHLRGEETCPAMPDIHLALQHVFQAIA
jgi:hypothetical protein